MKQMKRLLCGLWMISMVIIGIAIMPQTVQAKTASGNDGEIHWEIKGDTLTLSAVKGTEGRMNNYGYYWDEETQQTIEYPDAPWTKSSSMKNVKNIVLKNGITALGNMAFTFNTSVQKMTIAGSIKKIPSMFCWNAKIDRLIVCDGVEEISDTAFMNSKIYHAILPKSITKIDISAFCTIADGSSTYLSDVYGYSSSVAYNFVKNYNKLAAETYQNGSCSDGKIWVIVDKNGNHSKAIKFHKLNAFSALSKAKAPSSLSVNKGKSKMVKISLPEEFTQVAKYTGNPADVKITFKSSNPKTVMVSSNGKVTGKKKGTAKIRVSMQIKAGAKKTVSVKVTVK